MFDHSDYVATISVRVKYEGMEIEEFYENGQLVRRKITIHCWTAINETCYTIAMTGPDRIQLEYGIGSFIGEGSVISADQFNHVFELGN